MHILCTHTKVQFIFHISKKVIYLYRKNIFPDTNPFNTLIRKYGEASRTDTDKRYRTDGGRFSRYGRPCAALTGGSFGLQQEESGRDTPPAELPAQHVRQCSGVEQEIPVFMPASCPSGGRLLDRRSEWHVQGGEGLFRFPDFAGHILL